MIRKIKEALSQEPRHKRGKSSNPLKYKLKIPLLFDYSTQEGLQSLRLSNLNLLCLSDPGIDNISADAVEERHKTEPSCGQYKPGLPPSKFRIRTCSNERSGLQSVVTNTSRAEEETILRCETLNNESPSPRKEKKPPRPKKPQLDVAIKQIFKNIKTERQLRTYKLTEPTQTHRHLNPSSPFTSSDSSCSDHEVWDNNEIFLRGIDVEAGKDQNGAPFNILNLYKARYEAFPSKRENITNQNVVRKVKLLCRSSNGQTVNWQSSERTFSDNNNYSECYFPKEKLPEFLNLWRLHRKIREKRLDAVSRSVLMKNSNSNKHIKIPERSKRINVIAPDNQSRTQKNNLRQLAQNMQKILGMEPSQPMENKPLSAIRIRYNARKMSERAASK